MMLVLSTLVLLGGLLVFAGVTRPHPRRERRRSGAVHPLVVVGAALAAGCCALLITSIPVVALIAMASGAALPFVAVRRRERQHRRERMHGWPGVIDDVTSAVRAGLDLPEALHHAGTRAPLQLQMSFASFDHKYARTGDFRSAIEAMRGHEDDPVLAQLTQALILAREVGGTDLTQVLRSLGSFVRADLQLRGELEARQSWSVNSARMAVAAPWVVLIMLAARPATAIAYRSATGGLVLLGVAALSAVAYTLMLRIAGLGVL